MLLLYRVKIKHAAKWYKKSEEYLVKEPEIDDADYYTVYDQSHLHGASIVKSDCIVINKY
jgi:hypothetical protein